MMINQELNNQYASIKGKVQELIESGYLKEASSIVVELEKVFPFDSEILSMKTAIKFLQGNIEGARSASLMSLILDPDNFELYYNLAVILAKLGYNDFTSLILSKAIELSSNQYLTQELHQLLEVSERTRQSTGIFKKGRYDSFLEDLLEVIIHNHNNMIHYNFDIEYMDAVNAPVQNTQIVNYHKERTEVYQNIEGLSALYQLFHDNSSKETLLEVFAYRILGNQKVKLSINNEHYWNDRILLKSLINSSETLTSPYHNWKLELFSLETIGFPVQIYFIAFGVHATFMVKQYEYNKDEIIIKARPGDTVLDCGGCWGDTALYFASLVGDEGKVFTFEFIPSNLKIMKKNFELNSHLYERITIVNRPVWSASNELVSFIDQGPASIVSKDTNGAGMTVNTINIDDLVEENKLDAVDFIKMDIEGAEMNALKGAIETIRKFRPTLAISVYHQVSDFHEVALFIKSQFDNYLFTIKHSTTLAQETVLFASPKEKLFSK